MGEILPPMVKCNECIFAQPFKDVFTGKIRFMCQNMEQIGEFGDFYSLIDTACTEGIKKGDCPSINSKVQNNRPKNTESGVSIITRKESS